MRNEIAFIEAAYAAMRLGAYAVPVNWHFKPEETNYVLKDSKTSVLIGHTDMLHQLREVGCGIDLAECVVKGDERVLDGALSFDRDQFGH